VISKGVFIFLTLQLFLHSLLKRTHPSNSALIHQIFHRPLMINNLFLDHHGVLFLLLQPHRDCLYSREYRPWRTFWLCSKLLSSVHFSGYYLILYLILSTMLYLIVFPHRQPLFLLHPQTDVYLSLCPKFLRVLL
jgi:hypothetical protein